MHRWFVSFIVTGGKKPNNFGHSEFQGKRAKQPRQSGNSVENNQDRERKETSGVIENLPAGDTLTLPSAPEEQQAADVQQRPGTRSRSGAIVLLETQLKREKRCVFFFFPLEASEEKVRHTTCINKR